MNVPDRIKKLTETFDYNLETYKKGSYNETQVRREFIDPFFEELGWDITNKQGYAEAYKDVIHEDAIKIGGVTKAPDYCFRIGGARKFFLEAKKPAVNIREDIHPAYQLRRYGWSAKLPLSILTDFEEFSVYDCRVKPNRTDKAPHSRILYLKYTDYIDKWDEIANIFSREAILRGSFDKYVESNKTKKGTAEVDTAFLQEIERWREVLARNIALRNAVLTQRELNFAIQRTIDRIIFLRICEDRGIEDYGRLMALQNGENVYKRLFQLFRKADDKYNSGLFHFKKEINRDNFDNLTPSLAIDDKTLKDIFKNLYYPDSPYEFSVLPADILGRVYEKFLGKIIRLTPKHQAKIEEKPEVRKAGGVYYTPTYIVDYIVKQTVGKLVKGKKPGPRGAVSKFKILDPACGSGSFLIGAYQFLLDWHRDQYVNDGPEKWAKGKIPRLYKSHKGEWRLTTDERKRILLNNIYGVDIDHQAVEVTKLSLLLKVLEGEDEQSIGRQMMLFQERVLPDLSNNIKCGNSLIGPDFYENRQMSLFDEEEMYRVNAFDWNAEFPEIMKNGGFIAVIGNPPYIRSITLKENNPKEWQHYHTIYQSASFREWDIYLIFVEKGLHLLNGKGRLGYILPNKFFNSQVGEGLRGILSKGNFLEEIIHFGAFQIFHGATTYTSLLFLNKEGNNTAEIAIYKRAVEKVEKECPLPEITPDLWSISKIRTESLSEDIWQFTSDLTKKLKKWVELDNFAQIFKGTGTNADKVYLLEKLGEKGNLVQVYSRETDEELLLEPVFLKPALRGRSIDRYKISGKLVLIVPYETSDNSGKLVSEDEIKKKAPNTWEYLLKCKPRLNQREKGRFKGEGWYQYGRPQNLHRFDIAEKIVFPDVAKRGTCYLDNEGFWLLDTLYGITIKPDIKLNLFYILGILNSPVLTYFLNETGTALRGGYFRMKTAYLKPFPIRTINFSKCAEKKLHDQMVNLVEQMLNLNKKLNNAKLPQEKNLLQRQIETTDNQVDQLVYKLYDLTDEEIIIVESET